MKTNIDFFSSLISSEPSYRTLVDMIHDLDLEVVDIQFQA